MKVTNEVMWNTAENFAKILNDAFQKRFEKDNIPTNKESFIKVVGWIVESETKKNFVNSCARIVKYEPGIADELTKIVNMVITLPLDSWADDPDNTFEMFLALVKFNIECVKPNWK